MNVRPPCFAAVALVIASVMYAPACRAADPAWWLDRAGDLALRCDDPGARAEVLQALAAARLDAADGPRALAAVGSAAGLLDAIKDARQRNNVAAGLGLLLARLGDTAGGQSMARRMTDQSWRERTEGAIAQTKPDILDIGAARQEADALVDARQRVETCLRIAAAQRRRCDAKGALGTLGVARTSAAGVVDGPQQARLCRRIAEMSLAAGDAGAATDALARISDPALRAGACAALAQVPDIDLRWLGRQLAAAEQAAQAIGPAATRGWTLHDISAAETRIGNTAAATMTLAAAATAAADAAPEDQPALLRAIAADQAQGTDAAAAIATATTIQDPTERAWAFRAISAARIKSGDNAGARQALAQARAAANAIREPTWRYGVLEATAVNFADAGDVAQALATAHAINDVDERDFAHYEIAMAAAKAHDAAGARAAIAREQDPFWMAWTPEDAGAGLAAAGNAADALAIATKIGDASQRNDALRVIAEAQTQRGDAAGAAATRAKIHDPGAAAPGSAKPTATAPAIDPRSGDREAFQAISAQIKAHAWTGALTTAGKMVTPRWRSRAYGAIAKAEARAGIVADVERWVAGLPHAQDQATASLGAAAGLSPEIGEE